MLYFIICILLILFLLFLLECRRELQFFKVTHHHLCVPALTALRSEKKIMVLADLHNKEYGPSNQLLVEAIQKEKPDLILIPGDMIVSKGKGDCQNALRFMAQLPAICPVYYSLGNHEQRLKETPGQYEEGAFVNYKEVLTQAGVHFLENESDALLLDSLPVAIYGLELPLTSYKKLKRIVLSGEDMVSLLGKPDKNLYSILLAHNPAFFKTYKEWGADLTVSGHLHGGIIRIPGIGGLITPQMRLFPKYSGEMTVEEKQAIVVSRGLGTHTFNFRFCNYAEAVVIHLIPYR